MKSERRVFHSQNLTCHITLVSRMIITVYRLYELFKSENKKIEKKTHFFENEV